MNDNIKSKLKIIFKYMHKRIYQLFNKNVQIQNHNTQFIQIKILTPNIKRYIDKTRCDFTNNNDAHVIK